MCDGRGTFRFLSRTANRSERALSYESRQVRRAVFVSTSIDAQRMLVSVKVSPKSFDREQHGPVDKTCCELPRLFLNPFDMKTARLIAGQIVRLSPPSCAASSAVIAWPSLLSKPGHSVLTAQRHDCLTLYPRGVHLQPVKGAILEACEVTIEIIDFRHISTALLSVRSHVTRILHSRLQDVIILTGDKHAIRLDDFSFCACVRLVSTQTKTTVDVARVSAKTCFVILDSGDDVTNGIHLNPDNEKLEKIVALASGQQDGPDTRGLVLLDSSDKDGKQTFLGDAGINSLAIRLMYQPRNGNLLKIVTERDHCNDPISHYSTNQFAVAVLNVGQLAVVATMGLAEAHLILRTWILQMSAGPANILLLEDLDTLSVSIFSKVIDLIISCFDFLSQGLILASCVQPSNISLALRRSGRFEDIVSASSSSKMPGTVQTVRTFANLLLNRSQPCNLPSCAVQLIREAVHDNSLCVSPGDLNLMVKTSLLYSFQAHLRTCPFESLSQYAKSLRCATVSKAHMVRAQAETLSRHQVIRPVHWGDLGGLAVVKGKLCEVFKKSLLQSSMLFSLEIASSASGILLYGPPGCSKTMLARAIATESSMNFFTVLGAGVLSMWLGDSERALRDTFSLAISSPSIIFFDEIDALALRRGRTNMPSESAATDRVLAQLLVELDGVSSQRNCCVIAATNRPDLLDPALTRPGRIDHLMYIPPPDFHGRCEIFRYSLQHLPIFFSCNNDTILQLGRCTSLCSGAEIVDICRRAALQAIENIPKQAEQLRILVAPVNFFSSLSSMRLLGRAKSLVFYEIWQGGNIRDLPLADKRGEKRPPE